MNNSHLIFFAVLLITACSHQSNTMPNTDSRSLLNSERIHSKFGNYGISVLKNSRQIRVSSLFSSDKEGNETTRTLAVVSYPTTVNAMFIDEHQQIVAGQSIGVTFKNSGWKLDKISRHLGTINVPSLSMYMGKPEEFQLAIHIYDLFISKNDLRYHYATIAEIHHPEYMQLDDLKKIHNRKQDIATDKHLVQLLDIIHKEIDNLPSTIH